MGGGAPRALRLVALLAFAALSVCLIVEFDTPWYVASGRLIARLRSIPAADPFAFTPTKPWMNHEWLSELAFAGVHGAFGYAGLSVLVALVLVVALVLLARRAAGLQLVPFGALAFVLREGASPRAQLFSIAIFSLTLVLLLDEDERRSWWCVPIQLVWTQLHGGDPVGITLVGLAFLGRPSSTRLAVAVLCALATCAGPYGFHVHEHFLQARPMLGAIREFQPLMNALEAGMAQQWVSVVLMAAAIVAIARRPNLRDVLFMFVFTVVAFVYARLAVEASIVAAMLLSRRLPRSHETRALPATLALFLALLPIGGRELGLGLDAKRFPVAAVEFLRAHDPPGPMLNSYNFGGYLLEAYHERVFIDGRAFIVYDPATLTALLDLYDHPEHFAALDARYGFHLAVLQRHGRGAAFAAWLATQSGWSIAYSDDVAFVMTKA